MIRSIFLAIALLCLTNTVEAQYRKSTPKPAPRPVVVQRPVVQRPVYIAPIVNPQLRDYQWFLREQQRLNYLYQLESQRQMYQYQLDLQRRMLYGYWGY